MARMRSYGSGIPIPLRSRSATDCSPSEPANYDVPPLPGMIVVPNHTASPSGKSAMSCPNLLCVRSEATDIREFHEKLQVCVSLSDASHRMTLVKAFSRHRLDNISPNGSAHGHYNTRRTSTSVSSFKSSSDNETISCDESTELDISKVIPEIIINEPGPHIPYSDRNIAEILDFLFIGDLEAANREPLLCRLNVKYVVELINLTPQEVMKCIKLKDCPCVCASPMKHTRIRLNIFVDDSIQEDIVHYFDEVNNFIIGGVKSENNVLVYCHHGTSLAPTVVIQHLMQCQHMRLKEAYDLVRERRSQVCIPISFQRVLTRLERQLHPTSSTGFVFENEVQSSNSQQPMRARTPEAWT